MELDDWWRCSSFEELDNGRVTFSWVRVYIFIEAQLRGTGEFSGEFFVKKQRSAAPGN